MIIIILIIYSLVVVKQTKIDPKNLKVEDFTTFRKIDEYFLPIL